MKLRNYQEMATDFGDPSWIAFKTIVRTEIRRFIRAQSGDQKAKEGRRCS